jgi:sugar-specific transcriptional regulator TrmB
MIEQKITEALEIFNFTKAETKIYLTLLKLGESKVGDIIKYSKISSSNTHACLEKLLKKGAISFILKNKIKYFYPANPENLKYIIENEKEKINEKEKELLELIPKINSIPREKEISQGAEIFIGTIGLKSAFKKLTTPINTKETSMFFYKSEPETIEIIHEFYSKLELSKEYNEIKQKGIASINYKKYMNKRKNSKVKMKYTNLPIPSSINIYDNKTLIISWSKTPTAFLITSKQITETFKNLFQEIWQSG